VRFSASTWCLSLCHPSCQLQWSTFIWELIRRTRSQSGSERYHCFQPNVAIALQSSAIVIRCCLSVKVKGKGLYICLAPYCRQRTSKALRYGNALSRYLTVLPAHPRVYPRTEWTVPAFAFPVKAGTHLPTPKGWKAELAWATRTASKQSAQDCYAMFIAAANWSKQQRLTGQVGVRSLPRALTLSCHTRCEKKKQKNVNIYEGNDREKRLVLRRFRILLVSLNYHPYDAFCRLLSKACRRFSAWNNARI